MRDDYSKEEQNNSFNRVRRFLQVFEVGRGTGLDGCRDRRRTGDVYSSRTKSESGWEGASGTGVGKRG